MHNLTMPPGFSSNLNRHQKSEKIFKILEEHGKSRCSKVRLLDIGTGNGEIAHHLSQYYDVTSIDLVDQNIKYKSFSFHQVTDEHLPFSNKSFDIIISNHVIEHVSNPDLHLAEMARTLAPNGLIYLATPNRFWPWEVHYNIPILHYLPQPIFMFILKKFSKYHEDVNLLSWPKLKQKSQKYFLVTVVSDTICKWPRRYFINISHSISSILSWIPLRLYRLFTFIHPTLIVILSHK